VARRRSVHIDLAEADWYEASGYRLHYPRPNAAFAGEPADGPTPRVQVPLLRTLAAVHGTARIGLAEWDGYDGSAAGRELPGAVARGMRTFAGLEHTVWEMPFDRAIALVEETESSAESVAANYVWDVGGEWLVVSDLDLPSTYCATTTGTPADWGPDLEWVEVSGSTPFR